jgi:hypothetical protein
VAYREPNMEGEVPLYLPARPEKHLHRFPGCLILLYDKAVNPAAPGRQEDRTPFGLLMPDLSKHTDVGKDCPRKGETTDLEPDLLYSGMAKSNLRPLEPSPCPLVLRRAIHR